MSQNTCCAQGPWDALVKLSATVVPKRALLLTEWLGGCLPAIQEIMATGNVRYLLKYRIFFTLTRQGLCQNVLVLLVSEGTYSSLM